MFTESQNQKPKTKHSHSVFRLDVCIERYHILMTLQFRIHHRIEKEFWTY